MTLFPILLAACAIASFEGVSTKTDGSLTYVNTKQPVTPKSEVNDHSQDYISAGNYLISRYAQQHHDWKTAQSSMRAILEAGIDQEDILKRSMILSMGAGDTKTALASAHKIIDQNTNANTEIAKLFIFAELCHNQEYKKAYELIQSIQHNDNVSHFVTPYMKAWSQASLGQLDIDNLNANSLQLFHALLISDFLKDYSVINKMLEKAASVEDIHSEELLRIGDLYAHIGDKQKALNLYARALVITPDDPIVIEHKKNLEEGKNTPLFPPVKSAKEGLGRAFYDIATALYQDYNDESARIFAHLALYTDSNNADTKLLLAHIASRHDQNEEAISFFKLLPQTHKHFKEAQYKIAELLVKENKENEAIKILETQAQSDADPEAQVKIGDIHRSAERYGLALEAYNKAFSLVKENQKQDFWHLYYFRGMVQELIGNWDAAEKDLQIALDLQPDHPYILNYLGYGWADRGKNLDQAEKMIARAVELRPNDGYIMDSLGWVKYKTKDYLGATPILEQAVALLPYDSTINDHLGDAYWQVGRKREAKFQWERAKNFTEDKALIKTLAHKIENGLYPSAAVAKAQE